jgi:hypothetical protein
VDGLGESAFPGFVGAMNEDEITVESHLGIAVNSVVLDLGRK